MKLIVGANGKIGSRVAAALAGQGQPVRVFVRDVQAARETFGSTVQVLQGDLNEPHSVRAAMEGVEQMLLCTPTSPDQTRQQNGVIDAAKDAGTPYVVKVSGLATFAGSFVDSGRWHAETEAYLQQSGLAFTCLHPYFFMQNFAPQLDAIRQSGKLRSGVAEAAIAMVDAGDIAEVIVKLMLNPDLAPRQTLPLTAAQALTYAQTAELMGQAFDRAVVFQPQSPAEFERQLRRAGQPHWHIRLLLQFNQAFNQGYAAEPHRAAADILGRVPRSLVDYLHAAVSAD